MPLMDPMQERRMRLLQMLMEQNAQPTQVQSQPASRVPGGIPPQMGMGMPWAMNNPNNTPAYQNAGQMQAPASMGGMPRQVQTEPWSRHERMFQDAQLSGFGRRSPVRRQHLESGPGTQDLTMGPPEEEYTFNIDGQTHTERGPSRQDAFRSLLTRLVGAGN